MARAAVFHMYTNIEGGCGWKWVVTMSCETKSECETPRYEMKSESENERKWVRDELRARMRVLERE